MVVIHFMSSCLFVFDYKIIYTGQVKRHNTTTVSQKHASTSVITMLPTKSSSRLSTTSTKPPGMQYCQVTFLTFSTTVSFILRFVCGFTFVSFFYIKNECYKCTGFSLLGWTHGRASGL